MVLSGEPYVWICKTSISHVMHLTTCGLHNEATSASSWLRHTRSYMTCGVLLGTLLHRPICYADSAPQ